MPVAQVVFDRMPETLEEFSSMAQMDLTKPENTCAMFLCAVNLFVKDRDAGVAAINLLKGPVALNPHEISFLADRVRDKGYIAKVFFEGAIPGNNYTPDIPYTLSLYADGRPQDVEAGYLRFYLATAGADSKRAIKVRQKGDNWYLWDYPGLFTDVRKPAMDDPWA